MVKITAFQYINGLEEKRISYTYSVLDDTGNIIKSNIRKSTVIKDVDTDILNCVNTIIQFLHDNEQ